MKSLLVALMFVFGVTAQANEATNSSCAKSAEAIAKQMYLGTASAEFRNMTSEVREGFDENSDLAFVTVITEPSFNGVKHTTHVAKYKTIAKGSDQACEILSVKKLAN